MRHARLNSDVGSPLAADRFDARKPLVPANAKPASRKREPYG
jgi:hypothetical protein